MNLFQRIGLPQALGGQHRRQLRQYALAETINSLYKTEVVRKKGPWKTVEALEWETLSWVHWFNQTRLLEPIGHIPPAEFEALYERSQQKCLTVARLKSDSAKPGAVQFEENHSPT
jgi:hypothetical protein